MFWVISFAPLALFLLMLVCMEAGRRVGARQQQEEEARSGLGSVNSTVFALFGLLLAFSFSGAAERFQGRRALILQEANDLGTAWLRLDLLPPERQPPLRDLMRRYLDARLSAYARLPDLEAAMAGLAEANRLQGELWQAAVAACQDAPGHVPVLLLPALNVAFDTATARFAATKNHPPLAIYALLYGLGLGSAFLIGWGMARSPTPAHLHRLLFAGVVALTVYVTLDLELPRGGLIRVSGTDELLLGVRESMR